MTGTGPLSFDALVNDVNFRSTLDGLERRMLGFTSNTVRETNKLDAQFSRLGQLAAGYFSFQALSQLPAQILKVRGEFQQLEIAFTTMLRSKTKQEQLLGELVQTAATTPFNLKDIAAGAKQLLAYGSSAGSVVKEIRMLGDVASGVSVPIGELIYLYGTLRTQGRAYAVDIRQFAGRGIPIYAELAKVLGINVDKVNEFVENGKVGFKEVEQAFKNMTSSGGLFAGLMDAQSKSLLGLKERLGDAWDLMLNEIGKKNQDVAASLLTTATDVVENYQNVIDILKVAVATYGTYKAAILLVSVAQQVQLALLQRVALEQALAAASGEVLTAQQARQIVVSKLLQQATASLNGTLLANPYVLVATALAGLITAYFVFRDEVQQVKSAQEILAETSKNVSGEYRSQQSEIKTLIGVIQNQNVAESERLKAYEKLRSIAPDIVSGLDFQRAKTADLTKAVNDYLVSLQKKIRLESAQAGLKTAIDQQTEAADKLKKKQDELLTQSQEALKAQNKARTGGPESVGAGTGLALSLQRTRGELEQLAKQKQNADRVVQEIEGKVSGIYTNGSKQFLNAEIERLSIVRSGLDKMSLAYKLNEEELAKLTAQRDALTKAEAGGGKAVLKTVEYYDDEIKKLKELQSQNATTRADFVRYQKQIDTLDKQRRRLTGEMTSAEKKALKDADKVGPYGSLSYWETIAQKAQEIIDKTPSTNKGELARQTAIRTDAERRAEEIRKATSVKTFQEEIEEKKKRYKLYQDWVTNYGQQAADAQFQDLLSSGNSFVDYVEREIAKLEAERNKGALSPQKTENLSTLLTERDDATGRQSAIDKFREELAEARDEAVSLGDYLDILKKKQDALNPADSSSTTIAKRLALAEEVKAAERDRRLQLVQFLEGVAGSEEQRLAITKRYADLRLELEKKYNGEKGTAYEQSLNKINESEKQEFEETKRQAAETSKAFKDLNKVIDEQGRAALKIRLTRLQTYLKELEATVGQESELYKQTAKEIQETTFALDRDTLDSFKTFASLAGDLGQAMEGVNGGLGRTGRLLAGLASSADLVTVSFDKTSSSADKIAAGVQGVINLVSLLTSSAKERREAEEEYYRSMIAQQQAYNVALNDQIGLQSELSENVFVTNYEGRLRDGIAKMAAANTAYQKALGLLATGKAKTGQGNVIDWTKVGSGASSGAAAGAAIGSIVPVIGTAVGAVVGGVVGAVVGLFGGKKKQDEFGSLLATYPTLIRKTKDGVDELNVELAQTLLDQNLVDEATKQLLQSTIDWTEQIKEAREQIRGIISELAGQLGNSLRENLVEAFQDGTDAAIAFGESVSDVLEDVLSQLIFNQVFSAQFDELQKEMEDSFGPGGDGSWIDDFGRFFGKADELTKLFNDGLASAQNAAAQYGLNIFKPTNTTSANPQASALSGSIKGVTEETASVLAGQINAIRIGQAETGNIIRQQLLVLSGILQHTGTANKWLESIDDRLGKLESGDPLRGKGIK